MKKICFLSAIGMLFGIQAFSQVPAWNPGSTSDNVLYDPSVSLPGKFDPKWTDVYVSIEKSVVDLKDGMLKLETDSGAFYGYELKAADFAPGNAFTLDVKGQMLTEESVFGVNLGWGTGKNIRLDFTQNSIVDAKTNTVLKADLTSTEMDNYRIVVENEEAALYKNFDFITQLDVNSNDVVKDGGFESMTTEEASAYWGHDGYTKIEVVNTEKHSGERSMMWNNNWNGRFMPNLEVLPNATYELSFWAKMVTDKGWGSQAMNGGVWVDNVKVASMQLIGDSWKQYTCTFTTSSITETAYWELHNGWEDAKDISIYFDDITLTRTSETSFIQVGNIYPQKKSTINVGKVSFLDGKVYRPVTQADLNALIQEAETIKEAAVPGSAVGNYPAYAIERFETDINTAKQAAGATPVVAEQVDTAYGTLQKAIDLFKRSEITDAATLESITVSVKDDVLKENMSTSVLLSGKLTNGSEADLSMAKVEYKSLTPETVNVNASGVVTALAPGEGKVEVKVTLNAVEKTESVTLTVKEYNLSEVKLNAYSSKVEVGEATGTSYVVKMNDGTEPAAQDMTIAFQSLTPEIATISEAGTVLGVAKGTAKIELSVTVFGKTLKDVLELPIIELETVTITPASTSLEPEKQSTYTLAGKYSDGSSITLDYRNSVIWSDNRNVVRVNDRGNLETVNEGIANVEVIVKRVGVTKKHSVKLEVKGEGEPVDPPAPPETGLDIVKVAESTAYPLPFTSDLTVSSPDGVKEIEVLGLSGVNILYQAASGSSKETFNLGALNTGIYLLRVTDNNGNISTLKITKQ